MKRKLTALLTLVAIFTFTFIPFNPKAEAYDSKIFINEVMAANTKTIRDSDVDDPKEGKNGGEYSDWIELYNPGTTTINLSGYTLSDSESTWTIPSAVIKEKG